MKKLKGLALILAMALAVSNSSLLAFADEGNVSISSELESEFESFFEENEVTAEKYSSL